MCESDECHAYNEVEMATHVLMGCAKARLLGRRCDTSIDPSPMNTWIKEVPLNKGTEVESYMNMSALWLLGTWRNVVAPNIDFKEEGSAIERVVPLAAHLN
ncbi:hypothetical protein Nepgr_006146 [Nepenthes gracilis]|uniref:Uncharacterized protein n=1 Tax=Nepenthes gracilis TaxID=150966 RepID=A0AAD3S537_NEPGR|nr:hypothetical protein Nepgr_006146 [Nepenthes gracilis]